MGLSSSPTDVFSPWLPNTSLLICRVLLHFHHTLHCALPPVECFSFHAHDQNDLEIAASAFQHLLLKIPFLKTMMTCCCYRDLKVYGRYIYSVLDPRLFERCAPLSLLLHFVALYKCLVIIIIIIIPFRDLNA